ncbi:MAG: hypothetical protein FWD97_07295 [Defluviitaleaceae bacterium]|nr:hypothetical protein [Defluviitaleaceae bacterium]
MIKFSNASVYNFENAIRGARNPMNSWDKIDSFYNEAGDYVLGENDLKLARGLCVAGSDHRKFMRQIFVSVDINAPMYWWKEYDTYKVGTAANSTSTMHKIHSKPIELADFSYDHLDAPTTQVLQNFINDIEKIRLTYNQTKDKGDWYKIIQLLPSSYNQLRTCTMNYENLVAMYHARKSHKLQEWHEFAKWVETLPYAEHLITTIK